MIILVTSITRSRELPRVTLSSEASLFGRSVHSILSFPMRHRVSITDKLNERPHTSPRIPHADSVTRVVTTVHGVGYRGTVK